LCILGLTPAVKSKNSDYLSLFEKKVYSNISVSQKKVPKFKFRKLPLRLFLTKSQYYKEIKKLLTGYCLFRLTIVVLISTAIDPFPSS